MPDRRSRQLPTALFVALGLVALFGWLGYRELERAHRRDLDASLRSVLGATHEAARAWIERELAASRFWAESPEIVDDTRRLLATNREPEALLASPGQASVRRWLDGAIDARGYDGFELVDRDGRTLAASDRRSIGRPSTLPLARALLDSLWGGHSVVMPPRAQRADQAGQRDLHLFVASPVRGDDDRVLALLVVQLDPEGEFSELFTQGRFGFSGVTFAFDRDGRLLSASRPARGPGGDGPGGRLPGTAKGEAAFPTPSAVPGAGGFLAAGVHDERPDGEGHVAYHGTHAVGARLWDDSLGFGIATELDRHEANRSLDFTRRVLGVLTLLSMLLVVGAVQVRRRSRQVETLIDGAPLGMMLVDDSGTIRRTNPAVRQVFGYGETDLVGTSVDALLPEHLRAVHAMHRADFRRGPRTRFMGSGLSLLGRRRDGSAVHLEVALSPIQLEDTPYVLVMLWDIGARLETERALVERTEELARSNRDLEQFAYVASHDLRAPLRGIAQLTEWLTEDLGPNVDAESRQHLALVLNRVRRMDGLLSSLLEYARASRDSQAKERVNVGHLVSDVTELLDPPAGFTVRADGSLPVLETDRTALLQVMHNLIGNAVKHHDRPAGAVVVRGAPLARGGWSFSVTDDGPGIPEPLREKAFEMFQTLRPRDEVEGSGMGLALVKRIVERRGGQVAIEAAEPRGTTVRFDWPERTARRTGP